MGDALHKLRQKASEYLKVSSIEVDMAKKLKLDDRHPSCGTCSRTLLAQSQRICYALPPVIMQDSNLDDYSTRGAVVADTDPICIYYLLRMDS